MTAQELKKLRNILGMTQAAMAAQLGVSLPMYSLYERGKTPMSKPVEKLAGLIAASIPPS